MSREPEIESIPVPSSVRFPVELVPPSGFVPEDPASWPRVEGRLEYVQGRLLYMPPCGAQQAGVAIGVAAVLGTWGEEHPEFFVGGNEAGMLLEGDARGAEGAVWRREAAAPLTTKYVRVPPILAAEVAGREEGEPELRVKAAWYLARGVGVVWILLPATREVIVVSPDGEVRCGSGERLPANPALPGLEPPVERFFRQLG
jgi:Uma2 family endonuclease